MPLLNILGSLLKRYDLINSEMGLSGVGAAITDTLRTGGHRIRQ